MGHVVYFRELCGRVLFAALWKQQRTSKTAGGEKTP